MWRWGEDGKEKLPKGQLLEESRKLLFSSNLIYYIFPQIENVLKSKPSHLAGNNHFKQPQITKNKKISYRSQIPRLGVCSSWISIMNQISLLINIMGNIQVVQSSSKRKNIFNRLNTSQFRQSKSPRQSLPDQQNTHRFTNNNRVYKIRESDASDTSRHRNHSFYRTNERKVQRGSQLIEALQQSQPNSASNRIVNFNDFLIEIKKQMTENSNQYSEVSSQLDQTLKRGIEEERPHFNDSNKELKVNLRLENERFQLDKYKKIVERQLSKSHSIENISLQSKQDNQKLLIIKYGEYNKEQTEQKGKQNAYKTSSNMSFGELSVPITHLNEKIAHERHQYGQTLKQAKLLMQELTQRMESLGEQIIIAQRSSPTFTLEDLKERQARSHRITKISGLMSDINHLQAEQMAMEKQIKAAIVIDDDESSLSETLTQRQLANLQRRK